MKFDWRIHPLLVLVVILGSAALWFYAGKGVYYVHFLGSY